jgi:hypothetical protein
LALAFANFQQKKDAKTMANQLWRVVLCRIGSGCKQYGEGKTLERAYCNAIKRAGGTAAPYITGLSGSNGERFGPDFTATFRECFDGASRAIKGRTNCPRASFEDPCGANVEIIRVRGYRDNFLAKAA